MDIIKQIKTKCTELEKEYEFTILFAVESGSRLWGMSSEDSDFDVHLVFYYPIERYLSIHKPKDTFTWMSGNKILDINGFDIYKYAKLLLKSNPNMIDWTMSNIIYYGDKSKIAPFIEFAKNDFNPFTLYNFYYGISENTQKLISKGNRHYKKYLYVLRGLLNAKWIVEKNTLPPYNFEKVVTDLFLDSKLRRAILDLLIKKREASEKSKVQDDLDLIQPFIDECFVNKVTQIKSLENRKPTEEHYRVFNQVIQDIIYLR
jgi:predicted nucleotidyltransferase